MALAGLKAMLAGAVQDRMAAAGVMLVAGVLLATAWGLAIGALVVVLSAPLGVPGALLAVAGGLIVLAWLILRITAARNRRMAELRATTRALWVSTAVNAASAILRGEPQAGAPGHGSGHHRSALLVAGGLALLLLALLLPGGHDDPPGPDGAA